jgi:hypothetical protein
MRTYLKRLTVATFVILAVAFSAVAQESHSNEKTFIQKRAFEMFGMDLQRSDIPGVVESTLYTVVECKNSFPDLDYSRILSTVNKVAQENDNSSIAYKAYLASMYLSHSSDIRVKPIPDAENHEYLFKQIADQLEQKFLALQSDQNIAENK